MLWQPAALAAGVIALCAALPATADAPLTLDDAFARVASHHPELRLIEARGAVLDAEREIAAQRPPLVIGLQIENALGTGEFRGVDGAETTLTLASVLERGGKLDARRVLAQGRFDQLAVERETRRLDLLAEVARRFLALEASARQREVADIDLAQRRRTVGAARTRWTAGASPESVVLTAEANLARAELERARVVQQWMVARQHLAALWDERDPRFEITAGDLLRLPLVPDVPALATMLERTPELTRFADERRVGEARLQLARSAARPDLSWQVGVRQLRTRDDVALVAGFSLPLGSRQRAEPGMRMANAELAALSVEKEAASISLYSTLLEAHGRYSLARLGIERLRDEVLPLLLRAEGAAEAAYRAGAVSYLEWAQLQAELTSTRMQQLELAVDAQRVLIEIQRLTGQPFVATAGSPTGNTP